jgi:probable poly-beta-1,6-N-acetyl-D-glucosamine export protein
MGHCYGGWDRDTLFEKSFGNLVTGGTALFVFISGFFFHSVFRARYEYVSFLKKKFGAVFIPYLIMSSAFMLQHFILKHSLESPLDSEATGATGIALAYLVNLATGHHLQAYWYVPFVMLVFIASPFFRWTMTLTNTATLMLLCLSFLTSSFVHRPLENLNPFHSFLYFFPYYVLGIFYSKNRLKIEDFLERNMVIILSLPILIAIGMSMAGQSGNLHKLYPWPLDGFDYMIPQKISLIFALIALTLYLERWKIGVFEYIAKISFALFFIHPVVLMAVYRIPTDDENYGGLLFMPRFIFVLGVSVALAAAVNWIFGNKSKYLIGY